jgi:LysR family hca operon transcriptional activator
MGLLLWNVGRTGLASPSDMKMEAHWLSHKDFVCSSYALKIWVAPMELRHLRYFVAVAEEGSLTHAAERRLHIAQPSLSRQIRDLELEIGVPLLGRGARGVELTAAGRVFLDHARLVLLQVETASEAARRVAQPEKASFVVGFLTGHEVDWLPEALRILREEAPNMEIMLSSQSSPELAGALLRGKVDVAFLRREDQTPGLAFRLLIKEPLVAVLPSGHRLATRKAIRPQDIVGETFIAPTKTAPTMKVVIDDYAARSGIRLKPEYEAENLSMAMSLVASTGGITVLPRYAENLLSPSVVTRPLQGEVPTIDLVLGYNKANTTALLKRFLSRADELVVRVSQKTRQ